MTSYSYPRGTKVVIVSPAYGRHFFGEEGIVVGYHDDLDDGVRRYKIQIVHPIWGSEKYLLVSRRDMVPLGALSEEEQRSMADSVTKSNLVDDLVANLVNKLETEFPDMDVDTSFGLATSLAEDLVGSELYEESTRDEE